MPDLTDFAPSSTREGSLWTHDSGSAMRAVNALSIICIWLLTSAIAWRKSDSVTAILAGRTKEGVGATRAKPVAEG